MRLGRLIFVEAMQPHHRAFLGSSTCCVFTSSFSTAGSHLRLKCQTSGSIHFSPGKSRTQRFGSDKNVGICETTSRQHMKNNTNCPKSQNFQLPHNYPTNPCLKQLSSWDSVKVSGNFHRALRFLHDVPQARQKSYFLLPWRSMDLMSLLIPLHRVRS